MYAQRDSRTVTLRRGRGITNMIFIIIIIIIIPAITHHKPDGTKFDVFESGAILLYLTKHFDPEHKLSFPDGTPEDSETQQWLFFVVSNFFNRTKGECLNVSPSGRPQG